MRKRSNTSLMRRTLYLVVGALSASTIFATLAFVTAGRISSTSNIIESRTSSNEKTAQLIQSSPEILENSSEYVLGYDNATGETLIIIDRNGDIVYPNNDISLTVSQESALETITADKKVFAGQQYEIIRQDSKDNILAIETPLLINNQYYRLVSLSDADIADDQIYEYMNILLISTLAAAFFMMFPVTIMVRRILEPIQEVNRIAKEFGKGNFDVKAEEFYPGEVGELASTVNRLSDQLSHSINALTIERNRLEDIFNVISEGITVFNEHAEPTITNNTMNSVFIRVPRRNLFTNRLQFIPFNEVWEDIDEAIANGVKKERTLEGPDYAYQITIIPKFDMRNSKCIGATGFFRDITEELKLERTRRDYVANISHELRTPLQTLRGLIEPLSDGLVKKEEDKQRYYSIILNETLRLSRLIDDMLELSKLQSRTLAFKTFPFDINQLLSELETKFMTVMREAGITFRVLFTSGKLPTVMGNPDRVEQILVILLDNAKKYTPDGGSITISADYNELDGKVYISVSDTGQGIHEYDIGHIFDRFFKADRARGKKGTGLGLSIAKELLTYMGEDITVQSEYGHGTTFTFTLKKAEAKNAWKQ